VNIRDLEIAIEQAANNAKSQADTVAAKHAGDIKALKMQSFEEETKRIFGTAKKLGGLNAILNEKIRKIADFEEV